MADFINVCIDPDMLGTGWSMRLFDVLVILRQLTGKNSELELQRCRAVHFLQQVNAMNGPPDRGVFID